MGVGFGFAIAAQRLYPDHKVIMVEGDSGFGFSAMELETAARYGMPLKCVIINNSGVMFGTDEIEKGAKINDITPNALMPGAKYELLAVAFGGKGRSVSTTQELEAALAEMLSDNNLWVLNVLIDSSASMKAAKFGWLTSSKDISKPQDAKL